MFSFRGPAIAGLFIYSLVCLLGCPSNTAKVGTKPVAQVNDHVLTAKEFANQLARKLKAYDALLAKDPNTVIRTKEGLLNDFVARSLTLDWAIANNVTISDASLDKEVERMRASFPDDLSFRRSLAKEDLSFSEWRDNLRYVLIEREVFKKITANIQAPTDQEMQSYYNENKERFRRRESIWIRQIVVDDEAKIDAIKDELKKKDFESLAKKYSIAPESSQGGVVGWIEKGSVDFFDPLFEGPLNTNRTISSPFGKHLVRVEKKRPAGFSDIGEVRALITQEVRGRREKAIYTAWLDAQLRSSRILKDYETINKMKIDTKVKDE